MPKLEVFLSHRTTEARFADLIEERLNQDFLGIINLFYSNDITSVPVGTQWDEELVKGLQSAKVMLALCSRQSVSQPWINFEVGGAATRGIDIIPLCHSGIEPEQLPAAMTLRQGVTLTDAKSLERWYTRLSALIGCRVPSIDFEALARQFTEREQIYASELEDMEAAAARQTTDRIMPNPHVVCVTSDQYRELGVTNEIAEVLAAFPKALQHDTVTSSEKLKQVLSAKVDIVHIAGYVCPRSGRLYFSAMKLPEGISKPVGAEDFVTGEALTQLLQRAGTELVVIASGDSLPLIKHLLPVAHVISPQSRISATQMARWIREFYQSLWTTTLSEACSFASAQSGAAMELRAKNKKDGAPASDGDVVNADFSCAIRPT